MVAQPESAPQPTIQGPEDHAQVLHPSTSRGKVTLALKRHPQHGRWHETRVAISDLPAIARDQAGHADVYISQNRFWGRRRIESLADLDALFVDLDYYNLGPEWQGLDPRRVLDAALFRLREDGLPEPSLAIGSGRGLYLIWLHGSVPRKALPRWNACQKRLFECLQGLGADAKAKDAARVLRLIGTKHSESGLIVEPLYEQVEPQDFDTLADAILPVSRAELRDLRAERAKRRSTGRASTPQGFNAATLWEGRLSELQALIGPDGRWFGELPTGERDHWMFVAGVAMSWLCEPVALRRELHALAHSVASWTEAEARERLHSIFRRAHMAAKGEKIKWSQVEVDPRYRFRDSTIVDWLHITEDEMRRLDFRHLVTPEIKRERHREREQTRRRSQGATPRANYEANSAQSQKPWEALGISRATYYRRGLHRK